MEREKGEGQYRGGRKRKVMMGAYEIMCVKLLKTAKLPGLCTLALEISPLLAKMAQGPKGTREIASLRGAQRETFLPQSLVRGSKPCCLSESPGELEKCRFLNLTPRDSNAGDLTWHQ